MSIRCNVVRGMFGAHMTDGLYEWRILPVGLCFKVTVPLSQLGERADVVECDMRGALSVHCLAEWRCPSMANDCAVQSEPAASWLRPEDTRRINRVGAVNVSEVFQ